MDALRNIHATLAPEGFLIDTQPLSPSPRVATDDAELGALDLRAWADTIEAVDERFAETLAAGLYALLHEQRFIVTDSFDDGRECLETARDWRDTRIPPSLERRLDDTHRAVAVEQEVRLRLLRPGRTSTR